MEIPERLECFDITLSDFDANLVSLFLLHKISPVYSKLNPEGANPIGGETPLILQACWGL